MAETQKCFRHSSAFLLPPPFNIWKIHYGNDIDSLTERQQLSILCQRWEWIYQLMQWRAVKNQCLFIGRLFHIEFNG